MNNKYGYIYITTNLKNNKRYIGQKKSQEFLNWYLGSGKYLGNAIRKYKKDTFKVELVEWCSSPEELNEREAYWIDYHDAVNSDKFYNLREGGNVSSPTNKGKKMTKEQVEKLRLTLYGNQRRKGTTTSEEGIRNMSLATKKRFSTEEGRNHLSNMIKKNKKWDEDRRLKVSNTLKEYFKGREGHNARKRLMNNGTIQKFVVQDEIDDHISKGFTFGRRK